MNKIKTATLVLAMSSLTTLQATPGLKAMAALGALTGFATGTITNYHMNTGTGSGFDWAVGSACAGSVLMLPSRTSAFGSSMLLAHATMVLTPMAYTAVKKIDMQYIWNNDIKPAFGLDKKGQSRETTSETATEVKKSQ